MDRPPLIAAGGALLVDGLIADTWFDALRAEGRAARATAQEQRKTEADPGGWRSGNPARYLASARGGPVQDAIYAGLELAATLSRLAGRPATPTGSQGTFSYYDQPGHFLGLHRDIRRCDLTLLICLDREDGTVTSGALRLYPKAMSAPLDGIGPNAPHRDLAMAPGQSVVLLGGCIPHEVLPAAKGFARAVSVLCYAIATDAVDQPPPRAAAPEGCPRVTARRRSPAANSRARVEFSASAAQRPRSCLHRQCAHDCCPLDVAERLCGAE